jgi:hypothetical protein
MSTRRRSPTCCGRCGKRHDNAGAGHQGILACPPVSMQKSFDGLTALASQVLDVDRTRSPVRVSGQAGRRRRIGKGIEEFAHASLRRFQFDEALGGFALKPRDPPPSALHAVRHHGDEHPPSEGPRSAGRICNRPNLFKAPANSRGRRKMRAQRPLTALDTILAFSSPDAGNRVRLDMESAGSLRRTSCPNCSIRGFGDENQL